MRLRLSLICMLFLISASNVYAASVKWNEWDKAKVLAKINQKLLFINYEPKVITNLWKLAPILSESKLCKLINDNFIPIWFNASDEKDKKFAQELNLQENTITILDDEGEVYEEYNNADITEASAFEKEIQLLLDKIGLPPNTTTLKNLQKSLEKVLKAMSENKIEIAIKELIKMTEKTYRCKEIKQANELLKKIEDEAQELVIRATKKRLLSKYETALEELDEVSKKYKGLEIAELAKAEADDVRKSEEYKTWKKEIKVKCKELWDKASEAESKENFYEFFNLLFDIYELDYSGESSKALKRLKKLDEELSEKKDALKILESVKLDRKCKQMLAEAELAIKDGESKLAEDILNSIIELNPSADIVTKAKELLKTMKSSNPSKPDEPLKPSPHKF